MLYAGSQAYVPGATPVLLQAGLGSLFNFHSVFVSTLYMPVAGQVTFNYYVDDAWIMGIGPKIGGNGEQPVYISGVFDPPPPPSPVPWPITNFTSSRVASRFQSGSGPPILKQTVVDFPAPGYYPIEVDYTECMNGSLEMVLGSTAGNPIPNGPSATPSPAATCLRTALPTMYPWCSILNTPTAAPSAPAGGPIGAYPQSFYIHPTNAPASTPTATPVGWQGYF